MAKEEMSFQTRKKIDLLVQFAHSHSYYLKKIVQMIAADDKEEIKKLAGELAEHNDELEKAVKANTPK